MKIDLAVSGVWRHTFSTVTRHLIYWIYYEIFGFVVIFTYKRVCWNFQLLCSVHDLDNVDNVLNIVYNHDNNLFR
jgi:hypothetical protein